MLTLLYSNIAHAAESTMQTETHRSRVVKATQLYQVKYLVAQKKYQISTLRLPLKRALTMRQSSSGRIQYCNKGGQQRNMEIIKQEEATTCLYNH